MSKTEEKRDEIVGCFTTKKLKAALKRDAAAAGRSVSSHLHKLLEERYEGKGKAK